MPKKGAGKSKQAKIMIAKGKKMIAQGRKLNGGHKRRGGSKFTDFFTKTIPGAAKVVYNKVLQPTYEKVLKPAGKFIKDQHLISKGLALIPHPGAKLAGTVAGAVGLGHRNAVEQR